MGGGARDPQWPSLLMTFPHFPTAPHWRQFVVRQWAAVHWMKITALRKAKISSSSFFFAYPTTFSQVDRKCSSLGECVCVVTTPQVPTTFINLSPPPPNVHSHPVQDSTWRNARPSSASSATSLSPRQPSRFCKRKPWACLGGARVSMAHWVGWRMAVCLLVCKSMAGEETPVPDGRPFHGFISCDRAHK